MSLEAFGGLYPGQGAGLLRSPNWFHVLRLGERRTGQAPGLLGEPVLQTRARHILMRPTDALPQEDVLRRLREVRDRVLTGRVEFTDMARQYSIDGTASRGGDLGWLHPGEPVPAF